MLTYRPFVSAGTQAWLATFHIRTLNDEFIRKAAVFVKNRTTYHSTDREADFSLSGNVACIHGVFKFLCH
jgi:hypothetical protein